jgi:hypothetical protein
MSVFYLHTTRIEQEGVERPGFPWRKAKANVGKPWFPKNEIAKSEKSTKSRLRGIFALVPVESDDK